MDSARAVLGPQATRSELASWIKDKRDAASECERFPGDECGLARSATGCPVLYVDVVKKVYPSPIHNYLQYQDIPYAPDRGEMIAATRRRTNID